MKTDGRISRLTQIIGGNSDNKYRGPETGICATTRPPILSAMMLTT